MLDATCAGSLLAATGRLGHWCGDPGAGPVLGRAGPGKLGPTQIGSLVLREMRQMSTWLWEVGFRLKLRLLLVFYIQNGVFDGIFGILLWTGIT